MNPAGWAVLPHDVFQAAVAGLAGEVVAIVSGASDVEAPTQAVFMSANAAIEITRLGHDTYAFNLAEFIDPWSTPLD